MLLQVNVIVIAGLLILLTLQAPSPISPRDLVIEGLVLEKNTLALNETKNNLTQIFEKTNSKIDEKANDFLLDQTYEQIQEMNEYIKRSEIYKELPWDLKITLHPTFPANIILIPFALSSFVEMINWIRNRNDEPSTPGILLSALGFGIMVSVFATNIIHPI